MSIRTDPAGEYVWFRFGSLARMLADPMERSQICQALSETLLYQRATLAKKIGLPFNALDWRFQELFGETLEDDKQWTYGGH